MLILSRLAGQSILVGATKLTVLEVDRGRVRLAFEGPATVPIVRGELMPPILNGATEEEITQAERDFLNGWCKGRNL